MLISVLAFIELGVFGNERARASEVLPPSTATEPQRWGDIMPTAMNSYILTLLLALMPVSAIAEGVLAPSGQGQPQASKAKLEPLAGKCIGVSDGDTITVLRNKGMFKVRLHGIDCPERGQSFGDKARQFTSEQCFGKPVVVVITGKDVYGRLVGMVILEDGQVLNHKIVTAGLGWWYRQDALNDKVLEQLETGARLAKRGLWADASPTPPWVFRAKDKTQRVEKGREQEKARIAAQAEAKAAALERAKARAKAKAEAKAEAKARQKETAKAKSNDSVPTVYVTRTGKKYHLAGCRHLSKSRIAISLDKAKQRYAPCKVCRP